MIDKENIEIIKQNLTNAQQKDAEEIKKLVDLCFGNTPFVDELIKKSGLNEDAFRSKLVELNDYINDSKLEDENVEKLLMKIAINNLSKDMIERYFEEKSKLFQWFIKVIK